MEIERDADPDESWVAVSFDSSGTLVRERFGREALTVTR
jgi:hypothetical protein